MCRDVISKEVPDGLYTGQFWVNLPTKSRRIDFAIETLAGKRIAVELDGFEPHVKKLERDGLDDQLLRQNELVCAGWTVLRFSFDQLRKNPGQCKSMLRSVVEDEYSSFNKNPVLKGACLVVGCPGTATRLKSRAGDFFWKCQTCKITFNSQDISPETRFPAKEGSTGPAGATAANPHASH